MGKHPFDRKVFFVQYREEFLSLNEVRDDVQTGKLAIVDLVFDVDGFSYTAGHIVQGKAPKWALTAENDPMLSGLPSLSEAEFAAVDEVLCEDDFLEMPREPKAKTVKEFLSSEPRIVRRVAEIVGYI